MLDPKPYLLAIADHHFTLEYFVEDNRNTLECAVAEAAFMIGIERNADVVRLASYAPLFGHIDAWQWTPNLIWVDNLNLVRTPTFSSFSAAIAVTSCWRSP